MGTHDGGCQCGALRYRIERDPRKVAVCHCQGCQRQSGSAFGISLDVSREDFTLLSGRLRSFSVRCDSGRTKECHFCEECGTRIYHAGDWGLSVKGGTLDDPSWIEPSAHYWTAMKQRWVEIPDGVRCFPDDG